MSAGSEGFCFLLTGDWAEMDTLSVNRILWLRWTAANGVGELLGLGATFALTALVFTRLDTGAGAGAILLSFALAVASGGLEAALVGAAQWWAMAPWFPRLSLKQWWLATFAGALLAYMLGYLPSTLMDFAAAGSSESVSEPPQALILLLAVGMGAIAGAVLSFVQWLVLRKQVRGAGVWVPANMLAWAAGMPLIFWGMDLFFREQPIWQAFLLITGVLLAVGLVVGAVHGAFLSRLATRPTLLHST